MKMRAWSLTVLAAALGVSALAAAEPNIPAPTLGGKQVWSDVRALGTWRIQRNVLTDHYRLLDGDNWRQAWGTLEDCQAALDRAKDEQGIAFQDTRLVILVHGLGRAGGMFADLEAALHGAGFQTFAFTYPSTRQGVAQHADDLAQLIAHLDGVTEVSFVTHSMGALVVRDVLGRTDTAGLSISFRRLVMLAPPNQGSAIARLLKDMKVYAWLTSEAGQDLTPGKAQALPIPNIEFAIIAGGRGDGAGFNPLLDGDDDGVVTVAETRLDGAQDFMIVDAPHGLVDNDALTLDAVPAFLNTGRFNHAPQ